jgi:hypothetical protein
MNKEELTAEIIEQGNLTTTLDAAMKDWWWHKKDPKKFRLRFKGFTEFKKVAPCYEFSVEFTGTGNDYRKLDKLPGVYFLNATSATGSTLITVFSPKISTVANLFKNFNAYLDAL